MALDPLLRLPDELLLVLCEYLTPHDIWRQQRVSKSWQKFLSSDAAIRIGLAKHESHRDEDSASSSRGMTQTMRIDLMKAHYLGRPCETYQMRINNVSDMDHVLSAVLGSKWYVRPGSAYDVSVLDLCTNEQKIVEVSSSYSLQQLAISGSRLASLTSPVLRVWQLGAEHRMMWEAEVGDCVAMAIQGSTVVVLKASKVLQVLLVGQGESCQLAELPYGRRYLHAVHLDREFCYVFSYVFLYYNLDPDSSSAWGQHHLAVTTISLATRVQTTRVHDYAQRLQFGSPAVDITRMEVRRTGRQDEVQLITLNGASQDFAHSVLLDLKSSQFSLLDGKSYNYVLWKGKLYRPQHEMIIRGDSFPSFSCDSLPGMPTCPTAYIVRETSLNKPSHVLLGTLINDSFLVHYDWQNPRPFSVHAFQKGLVKRDHHKVHIFSQESITKTVRPRIECGWIDHLDLGAQSEQLPP